MKSSHRILSLGSLLFFSGTLFLSAASVPVEKILQSLPPGPDIAVVVGLPENGRVTPLLDLAQGSQWTFYFQSQDRNEVDAVRQQAEEVGLLGQRIFADRGSWKHIAMADNLAGMVLVSGKAGSLVEDKEVLRVLYPSGKAWLQSRELVKQPPEGLDDWSHPYHGPDNNPQSKDQMAVAPYLTQFIADPKFSPMPEVSVVSGGVLFKAFGHIAHKQNQNAVLNTLMGINAYNGQQLWRRPLREGFMIHRNTMIATPKALYIADHVSCQKLDPRTGKTLDEIVIPKSVGDGSVWKWMAMRGGVLHVLAGATEAPIRTVKSSNPALGHWPWGMWDGHDYKNAKKNFGFGRTFLAIDPASKEILWRFQNEDFIDSRGVCMYGDRLYFYCPEQYLACLDAATGKLLWKNEDADLLKAIGPNGRAQHYVTGYATTTYIKCNQDYIFFAGPQRKRLVVASAEDGRFLWQNPNGNLQLVLREDGFYAAGPQATGAKFDYATGKVLARLPHRRACTRATGSKDSVFFRTPGGTVRIDTETNEPKHIAPMRPPCQDGVLIAQGQLFWGPWMCGCQLSLYGNISLTAAGAFDFSAPADAARLEVSPRSSVDVEPFPVHRGDWPAYRHDARHSSQTEATLPLKALRSWEWKADHPGRPTAPVAAGEHVFFADEHGVVHSLSADGKPRWKAYTGGPVYFPPAVYQNKVFVGSADGHVYSLEAATGQELWRFRVGPAERRIPVYEKLIDTWPVSGGVVVQDGVVYAAAGIAHYDSTHVVALDAATGAVRWYNNSSGLLSDQVDSGISVQGELFIRGNELRFAGGGIYQQARFDLKTGKCLNQPHHQPTSRFQTACYAYYPDYAQYQSLNLTFANGQTLVYQSSYEGSRHSQLTLLDPLPAETTKERLDPKQARRSPPQGKKPERKVVWVQGGNRYQAWAVGGRRLLAAGQQGLENRPGQNHPAFLKLIQADDGKEIWHHELPTPVVKSGLAVDYKGRLFVALQDGTLLGFDPIPIQARAR